MDSDSLPKCDRPAEAHTNNLCNVRMTPQAQLSISIETPKKEHYRCFKEFYGSELLGFKQGTTFQQAICKTQHEQGCQSGF